MDRQRKYQWLFGVFVRLIGAARYTRASAPLLAGLALCIAGIATSHLPVSERGPQARLGEAEASTEEPDAPFADVTGSLASRPVSLRVPVRHGIALNREQQNIAHFIAKTYQLAVEQTQSVVEHAYRTARDLKLDPLLILAVISVESNFDPRAQSQAGAQGLMQVLTRVHADKFSPFGGVAAAFDPLANIRVGAQILNDYLKRDGSIEAALKAYVGAAALPHDGGYGAKVILERDRIAAAAAGRPLPGSSASVAPALAAPGMARGGGGSSREAGISSAIPETRLITDSPVLMPPPQPAVEVQVPESATPVVPTHRQSSDA